MKKFQRITILFALFMLPSAAFAEAPAEPATAEAAPAEPIICFESRKGSSEVTQREIEPGLPNVKCSPTTGAVLWWGDPFDGTVPMGDMSAKKGFTPGEAVVKPRSKKMSLLPLCGVACHNGTFPPPVKNKNPRKLAMMHLDLVPDSLNLQHGNGEIWCLDCHSAKKRNVLIDHFGKEISFDQPQKLCGKCHGQVYRDWRDGIHGKRIGQWASTGKKRWFVCTECHNPHDVVQGKRNSGFVQLTPEPAPKLPKGTYNTDHERHNPEASH